MIAFYRAFPFMMRRRDGIQLRSLPHVSCAAELAPYTTMMSASCSTMTLAFKSARFLLTRVEGSIRTLVTCTSTLNGKRWHSSSDGDGITSTTTKPSPKAQVKAPRHKRRTRPIPKRNENLEKPLGNLSKSLPVSTNSVNETRAAPITCLATSHCDTCVFYRTPLRRWHCR